MPLAKGDRAPEGTVRSATSAVTVPFPDSATVVFFYPTNQGSTCVNEVVDFDRRLAEFQSLGCRVVGVTTEGLSEVARLTDSKHLSIPLCTDSAGTVSQKFGVKNAYGFSDRYTFLIGKDGFVLAVWQAYDTQGHAEEVLHHCRGLRLR